MDSAKFVVVTLILVGIGLADLYVLRGRPGMLGTTGFAVTIAGLAVMVIGTALQFWVVPWGSYPVGTEDPWSVAGEIAQNFGTVAFTVGLIVFNVDLVRAKVMPLWAASILVVGALTTFYLGPVLWGPAVAWLVLALVLRSRRGQVHRAVRVREPRQSSGS
jgi:hypothetical protein